MALPLGNNIKSMVVDGRYLFVDQVSLLLYESGWCRWRRRIDGRPLQASIHHTRKEQRKEDGSTYGWANLMNLIAYMDRGDKLSNQIDEW